MVGVARSCYPGRKGSSLQGASRWPWRLRHSKSLGCQFRPHSRRSGLPGVSHLECRLCLRPRPNGSRPDARRGAGALALDHRHDGFACLGGSGKRFWRRARSRRGSNPAGGGSGTRWMHNRGCYRQAGRPALRCSPGCRANCCSCAGGTSTAVSVCADCASAQFPVRYAEPRRYHQPPPSL